MSGVVHVLDRRTAGDSALLACAAALQESSIRQTVVLVGDEADERAAWAAGVVTTQRIARGVGGLASSHRARSLGRLIRSAENDHGEAPIIQCWCTNSLTAASRALLSSLGPKRRPHLAATLLNPPSPGWAPARWRIALARATLSCYDPAVAASFCGPAGGCHGGFRVLDLPSLRFPNREADRRKVRERYGIGPDEVVVSLLADPPDRGDAMRFAHALGVGHAGGVSVVGLANGRAFQLRRGARLLHSNARRWDVVFADCSLAELIVAADIVVCDTARPEVGGGPTAGIVAINLAATAGVPIFTAPGAGIGRLLGATASLVTARSEFVTALLPPLQRLVADASSRALVAKAAGEAIRKHAGAAAVPCSLTDLWRELANEQDECMRPRAASLPLVGASA